MTRSPILRLAVAQSTAVVLVAMLVACTTGDEPGSGESTPPPGTLLRSEVQRDTSPDVSEESRQTLVAGNTAFAIDLHRIAAEEGGNVFVSPLSISLALAMTYAGARGETERQMAEALRYTLPQADLHPAFNWLDLELMSRGEGAAGMDGGPFRLRIANALWGREGREFVPEYLDLVAESYGAGLRLLDFVGAPEESRLLINEWVTDQTEGCIEDLIPPGRITADTALVLTNAIYFNAAWELAFDAEETHPGTFFTEDGGESTVDMMTILESFPYASGEGYQAIELPYDGDEVSLVIVLPTEGTLSDFEEGLTPERLETIQSSLHSSEVRLFVPRFTMETELSVKDALAALGMTDAFGAAADFSGMDPYDSMVIDDVLHKAFIEVNEEGTEAAAATAVMMSDTAVSEETIMRVDRPFAFLIRDVATGTILFMGRVANP